MALDALMREQGGVWVAHGAGEADRLVVDGSDSCLCRPSTLPTRFVACGSRRRRSPRTTAASPTRVCGRCATWWTCGRSSGARTGRPTRRSTARSPTAIARELGSSEAAGVHPGLPSRARRARAPGARPGRPHRALLAHSLAVSGSTPHLPLASRDRWPDCWPTI